MLFVLGICVGAAIGGLRTQKLRSEKVPDDQAHLADMYLATIQSLALAIDAKDQYTHQHILRVQRYAVATARYMGLTDALLEAVNTGALLHDIGKLGVPEYILLKPGKLTDDEFHKIKKYPEIGASILDPVAFPWPVLPAIRHHHEKWDGTGYPGQLKGEEIPITARILAVADVYDALTSPRSYRTAWTHERAIQAIQQDAGTHFDPAVVEAFQAAITDVIQEMAQKGQGPLAPPNGEAVPVTSKAEQAARDIQRASSELWALYEVAQTLSSSLGLRETLDILAHKLEAILPGTACVFLLTEEGADSMAAHTVLGPNRDFFLGCRSLNSTSVSLRVAANRQSYIGKYDPDDLLLSAVDSAEWIALESALIVPIVHQGEVLGTINLYHADPMAFGEHDRQLLEMIAERAAMALYNGILFDRTSSHAHTDPLTGLYNVRYLTQNVDDRCKKALTRRRIRIGQRDAELQPGSPSGQEIEGAAGLRDGDAFALFCLDLDSFKPINDNFGHQQGDEVLRGLARIFRELVREEDIVARYGGDEFLIVIKGAGPLEAEQMAERIHHAVEQYDPRLHHSELGALRIGVSVGYACFPLDGEDCAALLSAADAGMYRDKTERKRSRRADYSPIEPAAAAERETLSIQKAA